MIACMVWALMGSDSPKAATPERSAPIVSDYDQIIAERERIRALPQVDLHLWFPKSSPDHFGATLVAARIHPVPEELLLKSMEVRQELALAPAELAALDQEFQHRVTVVANMIKTLEDPKLTEHERALRLSAAADDPSMTLTAHRERLRQAVGAKAARVEQLCRQCEGPLGAFTPARRKEFEITEAQLTAVRAARPRLMALAAAVEWTKPHPSSDPNKPNPLPELTRSSRELLQKSAGDLLSASQAESWERSLGQDGTGDTTA